MEKIILFIIISIILTLNGTENKEISFKVNNDETINGYTCSNYDARYIINENDLVSVTLVADTNVAPDTCFDLNNRSAVFINKQSKYNSDTGYKEQGDSVTATLSMSTVWICDGYINGQFWFYCSIQVHVRSSLIPKITINNAELITRREDHSVNDYDAIARYDFVEDELLQVGCFYNEIAGMRFVYNNFGIIDKYMNQSSGFIYGRFSIHSRIKMKRFGNNTYIDCIVKRNEYRNTVVRLQLVLKNELANGHELIVRVNGIRLTKMAANSNVCTYIYNTREVIDITCESTKANANANLKIEYNAGMKMNSTTVRSNMVRGTVDMARYIHEENVDFYVMCTKLQLSYDTVQLNLIKAIRDGVTVYGLKTSNIVLQYQNEINIDVILYDYEDGETLNLKWFLKPEGKNENERHIYITWKDTIIENSISNPLLTEIFASHVFALSAEDNGTVISCLIRIIGHFNKELRIVLFMTPQKLSSTQISDHSLSKVIKEMKLQIKYNNTLKSYVCVEDIVNIVDENDLITVTTSVNPEVLPKGCYNKNNMSIAFINKPTKYNTDTGLTEQGDIVTATLSMSTVWNCNFLLWKTNKWVFCSVNLHVRSSRIPTITINNRQLEPKRPDLSVTDYDAEIKYYLVEGELIYVGCIYDEAAAMKFVYNGFAIEDKYVKQPSGFIYEQTSIHSRVRMKRYSNNTYIDCVVKRNEYRNAVVRVHLVLKNELANGDELIVRVSNDTLSQRKIPHNECVYIFNTIEIITITCESKARGITNLKIEFNPDMKTKGSVVSSNVVNSTISMAKYMNVRNITFYAECSIVNSDVKVKVVLIKAPDHDITVYGLKTSNILLQYQSEHDIDVILYEYEDGETLNLSWLLKPVNENKTHIYITWKDTVIKNLLSNTSLPGILASHVFLLSTADNGTVIRCVVRNHFYWSKELRIVLLSSSAIKNSPDSVSTGFLLILIGLGCVVCTAFIIVTLLIIKKGQRKTTNQLSETNLSYCETIDDRVGSQFPKQLDDYVETMAWERPEEIEPMTQDPSCFYSVPIPKSERNAVKNNQSLYTNVNSSNKTYTNVELHQAGVRSGTVDGSHHHNNRTDDGERYVNIDVDKDIETELYCDVNVKY